MATRTTLFSINCLRNESAYYSHAMRYERVKLCISGGMLDNLSGPIFIFASGLSVPISRGSPPIP